MTSPARRSTQHSTRDRKSKQFQVDQTAPSIAPNYSAAANDVGWNNTHVTVSYTCEDDTSGINPSYGCPNNDVLNMNGLFTLHRSTADNAGNVVQPDFTVKIDERPDDQRECLSRPHQRVEQR